VGWKESEYNLVSLLSLVGLEGTRGIQGCSERGLPEWTLVLNWEKFLKEDVLKKEERARRREEEEEEEEFRARSVLLPSPFLRFELRLPTPTVTELLKA